MKKKIYQQPMTSGVKMQPQGILCGSGATANNTFMNQNDTGVSGVWGN
jgi:hypothetical protein